MAVYIMATKGRGARLAPRKIGNSCPADMNAWHIAQKARELAEKRRTETVTIPVEIHVACGGQIEYTSYFRDTAPRSELVGGGHRPHLTEFVTCACAKCGSAITHRAHLARYAEQMTAHRNRTTD
jgi:hypothetical protein